nr:hypothetical protein BaRGS_031544 [Batillaria attramentaria]
MVSSPWTKARRGRCCDWTNLKLEYITTKVLLQGEELLITNCYSPPTASLDLHTIQPASYNHLIVGDFNGHSPSWGYDNSDYRGEEIEDWLIDNQLILINQPDDKPSYYSRAWKKTSTPDLAMATEDLQKQTTRVVSEQLGGSDHLPIILHIADKKASTDHHRKNASWNFKRADWLKYQHHAEDLCNVTFTEDMNTNVKRLTESILTAAKRDGTKTASLSMEKDTGKLWRLTKSLNEDTTTTNRTTVLKEDDTLYTGKKAANLLADVFEMESTIKVPPQRKKEVATQLHNRLKEQTTPTTAMTSDLSLAELNDAIRRLKTKKAPGKDGICNEMIVV